MMRVLGTNMGSPGLPSALQSTVVNLVAIFLLVPMQSKYVQNRTPLLPGAQLTGMEQVYNTGSLSKHRSLQ